MDKVQKSVEDSDVSHQTTDSIGISIRQQTTLHGTMRIHASLVLESSIDGNLKVDY